MQITLLTWICRVTFCFRHVAIITRVGEEYAADHTMFLGVFNLYSSKVASVLGQRNLSFQLNAQLHQPFEIVKSSSPFQQIKFTSTRA